MKRLLDIVGALLGLVAFAPILLFVSLKIRQTMGSPVLFRQTRLGPHGVPFETIKFQTMRNAMDVPDVFFPPPNGSPSWDGSSAAA